MQIDLAPPGALGVAVTDLDARAVTAEQAAAIRALVYQHKLVVFRGQELDNPEYVAFARAIGRPQIYFQPNYHHPAHPEIFVSSNVPENGKKVGVSGTGRYWHTDYQFFREPLPLTMVYPKVLPRGFRGTYYIDMQRVFEELPADLRAGVVGRRAVHDAKWRYKVSADDIDKSMGDLLAEVEKLVPPLAHPAVITHPVTRARSLYVSSGFTHGIEGLSSDENAAFMARLFAFVERDDHVHTHRWEEGDILLWDNRPLLHKASNTPKGEKSSSYRIGIYDDLPFYVNDELGDDNADRLAAAAG
jgi:taurine dioxygenase